jgi:RhoGEF domain
MNTFKLSNLNLKVDYLLFFVKDCEQKHPAFAKFRRQQEELAEMNGLKLNALLITPVQRVPRYNHSIN